MILSALPPRLALALAAVLCLASCGREPDLVVYVALDQVFSEPLIERFEQETGLVVQAEYDVEASKTVGLTRQIIEERDRVRCDVFWNNEIVQTVKLANQGLLQAYDSPSAADIPESFRDPERRWTGFGARARILIVNTDLVDDPSSLTGIEDLFAEEWKGKAGIARPLTGTTLTHAAVLFDVLGEEKARELLTGIQEASMTGAVNLMRSNGEVMRKVSAGEAAWGWTDTDDFNVAREKGHPVTAVYPDQGEGGLGALLIPNTISMLANAPHPEAAKRFIDWVLTKELERELAFSDSAQIPVRPDVERPGHVKSIADFKVMAVDFQKVGDALEERTAELTELFLQ